MTDPNAEGYYCEDCGMTFKSQTEEEHNNEYHGGMNTPYGR